MTATQLAESIAVNQPASKPPPQASIRKLLIANRGEIAIRVIRACRDLGIQSVAVYSEADRTALHVRLADEAYYIGPSPARESYLRGDYLIELAQKVGADAIHPGYGFLAENAGFARAVTAAGLIFVGPPAAAMEAMGDKVPARQQMARAGVPIVPGITEEVSDPTEAQRIAAEIGYPVLIKASAGGGGKGQRVVSRPEEMADALAAAGREAASSFGYAGVYIERYLPLVRHIEIQVVADQHGNAVYLGERECSLQRRRQKVVEEAPSPILPTAQRQAMGAAAVRAAQAVGYYSLGTVEFLYTPAGEFYFLEMNTRLQVEHPVTEMITGLDLVTLQIKIAAGEAIPFSQDEVELRGHAIECRVIAEDAAAGFMPSIGRLSLVEAPSGPGVRLDSALAEGYEVSLFYDSLLGKLITWGADREQATARMQRALAEFRLVGVQHNLPFLRTLLASPEFAAAAFDTGWIERNLARLVAAPPLPSPASLTEDGKIAGNDHQEAAAIVATFLAHQQHERSGSHASASPTSDRNPWRLAGRQSGLRRW